MEKIIRKIIGIINKPTDQVNPIIFLVISIAVLFFSKNADGKYVIIFGVTCGLVMVIYTVISVIKHDDITKIIIYLISLLLLICGIFMYYFRLKTLDINIIGIIAPILLMLLMFSIYMRIKKLGNKEDIRQAKIIVTFEMIIMTIVSIFFTYALVFK